MCLAQDMMALRFGPGPDYLVMATMVAFYAVQLARNVLPPLRLSARPA